jgi:hypothetical protein
MTAGMLGRSLIIVWAIFLAGAKADTNCAADLGQGWTKCDRDWWYTVSQGSRLLPLSWMLSLEQPDNSKKILDDKNVARFNYLLNPKSEMNPHGLPLGFTTDVGLPGQDPAMCRTYERLCESGRIREPWVGFNCSACHTNELTFKGRTLRIDGAPTLADFQGLLDQILAGLTATDADDTKFERFAKAVLGVTESPPASRQLRAELREVISWEKALHDKNGDNVRYGFGRLDAQGHILNKVSLVVGANAQLQFPSDAPASYPYIWNAPQHDLVQWNGLAPNQYQYTLAPGLKTNIGALARNTGEVIGVFAQIDSSNPDWIGGYRSSVQLQNLIDIERRLGKLRSPKWPEDIFGKIDPGRAHQGAIIFRENCAECHALLDRMDLTSPIKAELRPLTRQGDDPGVGTDLALACNTFAHRSKTGEIEDRKILIVLGDRLQVQAPTTDLLRHLIAGAVIGQRKALAEKAIKDLFSGVGTLFNAAPTLAPSIEYLPGVSDPATKLRAERCLRASGPDFKETKLAYKARPLNGIWATAPYLHNGSVPTLYDLLLPTDLRNTAPLNAAISMPASAPTANSAIAVRPDIFYVGSREFDEKKVGFVATKTEDGFQFRVRDQNGQPIFGNYNSGHQYGTQLSDEDRWALVEYLKTL